MDMMMVIYEAMMSDDYIKKQAGGRIKFYEYPQAGSVNDPYIVIDPLAPPLSSDYGDNEPLYDEYLYQIDVWTKNRLITKELSKRIRRIMRNLGYGNFGGAADEYDKDTKIYRDARRYKGKAITDEMEALI